MAQKNDDKPESKTKDLGESSEQSRKRARAEDQAARARQAEEEAEDEDEDEDDDEAEDEDEDEDDDDDEDEDEDEDEDDKAEARDRKKATAAGGRSTPPHSSRRAGSTESSQDWLPDWAPWAVMGVLVLIGLLGFLGVFSSKKKASDTEADTTATTTTATTATATATATGAAANKDQEVIEASHLLVMYKGSLRAPATITRSKEEAKKRADQALARAKKGEDFAKLVGEFSDEPGAAARGGRLGRFSRRAMVPAFSEAAFALKPGQMSNVVETQFGFHVIKRMQ